MLTLAETVHGTDGHRGVLLLDVRARLLHAHESGVFRLDHGFPCRSRHLPLLSMSPICCADHQLNMCSCVPLLASRVTGVGAWSKCAHFTVAGILHVQIVLSHWSMETYKGSPYTSKNTEWYLMQLRTTLNVDTWEWFDFAHVGLQFQVFVLITPSETCSP